MDNKKKQQEYENVKKQTSRMNIRNHRRHSLNAWLNVNHGNQTIVNQIRKYQQVSCAI